MNYKMTLIGGDTHAISENDYKKIGGSEKGLVFLPDANISINTHSIAKIEPEIKKKIDLLEDRKENKDGVLHDGTHVVRQYGKWCDPSGPVDENGNYLRNNFNPSYYPELARDCVPSPDEYYKKYSHLPRKKRLEAILSEVGYEDGGMRLNSGFSSTEELIESRVDKHSLKD